MIIRMLITKIEQLDFDSHDQRRLKSPDESNHIIFDIEPIFIPNFP